MRASSPILHFVVWGISFMGLASPVLGQTETVLHSFGSGTDGHGPTGTLVQGTDGNFYGMTATGGTFSEGTAFRITPQGVVTILHHFGSVTHDGTLPHGSFVLAPDGNLYGTTALGGTANLGTVFTMTPQGAVTILHTFHDGSVTNDGSDPQSGLILGGDGNFYGTTLQGGAGFVGTVYRVTPQGAVTILHSFQDGTVTNDGLSPQAPVVQGADGNFYGTTPQGGPAGRGTAFQITPQGTVTILHSFGDGSVTNDGQMPMSGLIQLPDGNFYGTTSSGSVTSPDGVVYKMTPAGSITILHTFLDRTVLNDGNDPNGALVLGSDGNLYGTTQIGGGVSNVGCVYEMSSTGKFLIVHGFQDGSVANDGSTPLTALVQGSDGNLYGMTQAGGANGGGTAYVIAPTQMLVTSPTTATASVTQPFSYQVVATHAPIGFSATNLPDGLSIDPNTGLITGTPTTVQTKVAVVTLTNAIGSENFLLTINVGALPAPAVTSVLTAYGSVETAFTYNSTATNSPTSYAATGLTGTGLSIDPATGIISGSPTSAGTLSVSLTASNATGPGAAASLSIYILAAPPTLSQEYNVLHRFGDGTVSNDGVQPFSIIQAFDGNFYGADEAGGTNNAGAIFKMTPQGVVSNFYSFNGTLGLASPQSLIQAANGDFIGTTSNQIFRLTQTGQLSILHVFSGISQLQPLVQGFDGDFYSVVAQGGTALHGFAYKITPQGDVTILHNFRDGSVANDGITPQAALIQASDGNFYGTTEYGGSASAGTIFKMTPTGIVTILHNFNDNTVTHDGNEPQSSLVEGADGNFYGTTDFGTSSGTVFKMTPQGTVTILHVFGDGSTPNDGHNPLAGLIQGYDGNFYGTTIGGGAFAYGTAFQITPQGVLTIIHNFGDSSFAIDGTAPRTLLVQSPAGNFYGITSKGGTNADNGTIFSFDAMQAPTNVPIFIGSAFQLSAIYSPFSFTPKALFGVSGAGEVNQGQSVRPSGNSLSSLIQSFFLQIVHPNFSATNWMLTGTLPNYLTFDPSSGTISGTPVEAGVFTVTMTPHNAIGWGMPMTITLFIDVPPGISSPVTISTAINMPFSYQIASTPPASDYGASNLPGWLSVDSVSGIISGTPPAGGTYVFDAVASNVSGQTSQAVALTVTGGSSSVPTITSATTASIAIASPFGYQITASPAATSFTAFSMPAGLVFNATSGDIFGIPTAAGTYEIPLTAVNSNGSYASVLSLTVTQPMPPGIASTLSATAALNVPFSYQIPTTGTVTSYGETGSLPNGITFDSTMGIFSGTPSDTGSFPINLTVTNGQGSSTSTLTITVVVPQSFSDWQSAFNTTGDPSDTPFHDGIPNLLKYLYNIDPTHTITPTDHPALPMQGIATVNGTQYLTLTYRQYLRQTGLTINVQSSPDLIIWTTDSTAADQPQLTGVTDPVTGDPYMRVKVPITAARQFIRLNVTAP